VVDLFREERARLRGELHVSSAERGAIVTVDGKRAGACPVALRLPIGVHEVKVLDGEGRVRLQRRVLLAPGQVLRLEAGRVQPSSAPSGRPSAGEPRSARGTGRPPARIWTWVAAGGALAAAGAGLGLWLWGRAGYDEYLSTADHARYLELQDSVPRRYIAADVMLGVAAGLAVTAAVLFVLEPRVRAPERAMRWAPLAAGLGVALEGRF
jgi:hypothetical protein